jgi:hypothetical protein
MKMKKVFLFSTAILFILISCSKKDDNVETIAPPTNIGTGTVNYNGPISLSVKAILSDTSYLLQGDGKTPTGTLRLTMEFPKKPVAGTYNIEKDKITVKLVSIDGFINSGIMKPTETITVTVKGNRLEASFKDASFDFGTSGSTYTGNLSVD